MQNILCQQTPVNHTFAPIIVNVWNSLPEIVISADTTDTFKRRLDKFWQHQDILYDY